jgi:hypothetical protein
MHVTILQYITDRGHVQSKISYIISSCQSKLAIIREITFLAPFQSPSAPASALKYITKKRIRVFELLFSND